MTQLAMHYDKIMLVLCGDSTMTKSVIVKDPDILGGVPVHNLIDYLTTGDTIDAFLDNFPTVKREQVTQFLQNAGTFAVTHANENTD